MPCHSHILKLLAACACGIFCGQLLIADELRHVKATGLVNPESVVVGFDGRIYISEIGERNIDGDGRVSVISKGKVVPFATGLNDPKGIVAVGDNLYVADKVQVWKIDRNGKATVYAAKEAFPVEPLFLNDVAADPVGNLYVSDSGTQDGSQGKVFRISFQGKVSAIADDQRIPGLKRPNGVLVASDRKLLLADVMTGALYRVDLEGNGFEKVADGLGAPDGIVEDAAGNLFVSDVRGGKVYRVRPGNPEPELVLEGLKSAADICAGYDGKSILIPDMQGGSIVALTVAPSRAVAPAFRDLKNPESIVQGADGAFYVTAIGEFNGDGDGLIMAYPAGKPPVMLAQGLDDPKGICLLGKDLVVTDKRQVVKVDLKGNKTVLAAAEAFPEPPLFLNDIAADTKGNLYVSDSGDLKGNGGAVYKISPDGKVSTIINSKSPLPVKGPNGVLPDGQGKLWVVDFFSGDLLLVDLADNSARKIADGFPGGDGLVLDNEGNLYISQWSTGQVSVLSPGASEAKLIANQFVSAADMCLDERQGYLMVPDMKAGTITKLPLPSKAPAVANESPLEVRIEQVFPELVVDRPIVLTHAGDGSNRIFVAGQNGEVFVLPSDSSEGEATRFLDWRAKTAPYKKNNEEGFLGMAFHPKFKQNGELFIYYTAVDMPRRSVISRIKVDPKSPNQADPASEVIVLEIHQPYGNHNGGTIAFGPDGYLYIGMGDGGSGGDPHGNGQKMDTLLGKILRIDVDNQANGKNYAIPSDNPFANQDGARGEIWALGIRNIWRLSFDRETGDCWAGEVGQNIWEEVNLIVRGGNYGWNPRESMHRFTAQGSAPKPEFIEPVWEYHHDLGKSITGGNVYRGKRTPELLGQYLYADYVTGRIWALEYDLPAKRALGNRPIFGNVAPVMSFGEDQNGEVYFLTFNGGVFRFASIPAAIGLSE